MKGKATKKHKSHKKVGTAFCEFCAFLWLILSFSIGTGLAQSVPVVSDIAPALAPNWDATHYLTASGLLPYQRVLHPSLAKDERGPDFVITLGRPLEHRGYRLVRQWRAGWLYQRIE